VTAVSFIKNPLFLGECGCGRATSATVAGGPFKNLCCDAGEQGGTHGAGFTQPADGEVAELAPLLRKHGGIPCPATPDDDALGYPELGRHARQESHACRSELPNGRGPDGCRRDARGKEARHAPGIAVRRQDVVGGLAGGEERRFLAERPPGFRVVSAEDPRDVFEHEPGA